MCQWSFQIQFCRMYAIIQDGGRERVKQHRNLSVKLTLLVLEMKYFRRTRSTSLLLMHTLFIWSGHQKPWSGLNGSLYFPRQYFTTCTIPVLIIYMRCKYSFFTLRPRQKGRHSVEDIFKCIFLNGNIWISLSSFLRFEWTIYQHWFR